MKKLTYLLVITVSLLITLTPLQTVKAEKYIVTDSTQATAYSANKTMLKKYYDLVTTSHGKRKNGKLIAPENELINGEFAVLNLVTEKNTEVVDHEINGSTTSVIQHDTNNDIYSLITVAENNDYITYIVDGEVFEMRLEGENINLYSTGGQVLPLVITENDYFTPYADKITDAYFTNNGSTELKGTKVAFSSERGPFYKTNKTLVEVLSTLAAATALIKHPVFAQISVITGTISFIAGHSYATLYIKFWQSNSLSDLTYVKERGNVYNYNNYTSQVTSYTHYFYSAQS